MEVPFIDAFYNKKRKAVHLKTYTLLLVNSISVKLGRKKNIIRYLKISLSSIGKKVEIYLNVIPDTKTNSRCIMDFNMKQ